MKKIFKENKKTLLLLLGIILLGTFLRTFHFSDWLKFAADQARDANIVRGMLSGKNQLPLLGPQAANTKFLLGPAFYYLQFISAFFFGTSPDKMAYPDLVFSILAIPLLFFLLKSYFTDNISLLLTALYSVSFVAVQNGRFAWNPNSIPFFSLLFLYAFLKLLDAKEKKSLWAIITGIAIGIGIQLHSVFLLVVPFVFIVFSFFVIKKKNLHTKTIAIVIGVAILLNITQLISEIKTRGENLQAFTDGLSHKSADNSSFFNGVFSTIEWSIQANSMFITPFGNTDVSDFSSINTSPLNKKIEKKIRMTTPESAEPHSTIYLRIILATLFSIGGYLLFGYYLKEETSEGKRTFLHLTMFYTLTVLLVLIPVANGLGLVLRYFLILEFFPFILLGFYIQFLFEKFAKKGIYISYTIIAVLILANIIWLKKEFDSYSNNTQNLNNETLSEEESVGNFIASHTDLHQQVYVIDQTDQLTHFIKPLYYFAGDDNIIITKQLKDVANQNKAAYFSLQLSNHKSTTTQENSATYGRLVIEQLIQ